MDIKYCLKDVKPANWTKELESAIAKSHTTLQHLYTPGVLQTDILDQCAEALTSAMQTATAATTKIRKPCAFAKPWWDQDLAAAADRVSEARKEQKREVLAVPPLFLQESGHSGGIPVDSGGMGFGRRPC